MKQVNILLVSILFYSNSWAQMPVNEEQFKDYFTRHVDSLDQIEGIWNVYTTLEIYQSDTLFESRKPVKPAKIAIMKKDGKYESYELSGHPYNVQFSGTDVKGVYFYRIYYPESQQYSKKEALISKSGEMEYSYDFPDEYTRTNFKDIYTEGTRTANNLRWSRFFPIVWKK